MDTKTKTAVIVAVIIVVLVGVYAAQALDDKHEDARESDDDKGAYTYYFYLDGMDSHNGWYTAHGNDVSSAFTKAMDKTGLTVSLNSYGMIVIDEYPASYSSSTNSGTGLSVYTYTSTDVSNPYEGYFCAGPVISNITGNIAYISYGSYTMDATTYAVSYTVNPSASTAWKTGGPFVDAAYQPIPYSNYSFYLDGMGAYDGWYSATGSNAGEAFLAATKNTGLTVSLSSYGMIQIDQFPGSYNSSTNSGSGFSVYTYTSSDVSNPNAGYFFAGPVVSKIAGSIAYISYGSYTMDATTYAVSYTVNPSVRAAWQTTGPFGTGSVPAYEMYYYYIDGMDSHNGWYAADGQNAQEGLSLAAVAAGLTVTFTDSGWMTIEGYEGSYDRSTSTGTGVSVYTYTSTDVANPDARYFATGPVLKNVLGNIIYITYSSYSFDADGNTINAVGPSTSDAWKTGGPFASGAYYEVPSYDTYYFYLGGVGTSSGWYSASGSNVKEAFLAATAKSGLTITLSDSGWLTVAEYPGSYDAATSSGEGFGVYTYLSSDSVPSTYSIANGDHSPVIPNSSSNIVMVFYSAYSFDASYNTTYTTTPWTDSAWQTSGPFAA